MKDKPSSLVADGPVTWAWASLFGVVVTLALPLYLMLSSRSPSHVMGEGQTAIILQLAIVVTTGLVLTRLFLRASPDLFLMTVTLYVYVFLGLAPLSQIRADDYPGSRYVSAAESQAVSGLIALALACFLAGRWLAGRRLDQRDTYRGPLAEGHLPQAGDVAPGKLSILVTVGVPFYALYVGAVGFGTLFALRSDRGTAARAALGDGAGTTVLAALATIPIFVASLAALHRRRQGRRSDPVVLVGLIVMLLLVSNPISTSRFTFGVFAGSLLIVGFRLTATSRKFRALLVSAVVVLVAVFPYADYFRNDTTSSEPQTSLTSQYVGSLDYDSYAQVALAHRYVQSEGHTNGEQALGGVLAAVPRSVWPDKPRDTGIVLAEFAGYDFTSVSAPLVAEAYIDFGTPGVALLFGLVGWVTLAMDRRYAAAVASGSGIWVIAAPALALYTIMTLRGSFLQQAPRLFLLILLFWWLTDRVRRSPNGRESA